MPETQEMGVQSLVQEDPLEEEMATHSLILVWEILWTEEPCGVPSMGSKRVGHDLEMESTYTHTLLSDTYHLPWQPPCSHIYSSTTSNQVPWSIYFKIFFSCGPFLKSSLNLLYYCFCFMYWIFGHKACEILAGNQHPLHWKVKP